MGDRGRVARPGDPERQLAVGAVVRQGAATNVPHVPDDRERHDGRSAVEQISAIVEAIQGHVSIERNGSVSLPVEASACAQHLLVVALVHLKRLDRGAMANGLISEDLDQIWGKGGVVVQEQDEVVIPARPERVLDAVPRRARPPLLVRRPR